MTNDMEELVVRAERYQEEFTKHVNEVFAQLQTLDPGLANYTVEVLEDRLDAALWMLMPNHALKGKSPLSAVADGCRQDVLDILGRIEHGTLS